MNDDNRGSRSDPYASGRSRSGRHAAPDEASGWPVGDCDSTAQPQWPTGDEPRWPTAAESGWERPPQDLNRGSAQWRPSEPRRQRSAPSRPPQQPAWPTGQDPDVAEQRHRRPGHAGPGRQPYGQDRDARPTDMLPAVSGNDEQAAEPELLTHREDAPEPDAERRISAMLGDSGAAGSGGDGDDGGDGGDEPPEPPISRKKRRRRRIRRILYVFFGVFFVLPILAFAVAYFFVDYPEPHEVAADQAKTVTYAYEDGSVLGQDSQDGNREMLDEDDVPDTVKHAVYAAEDASFETNSGFDVSGIVRAARNQLSGGAGGGSTITQQYVKQATQNDERTLTRKGLEVVRAFKMSNQLDKSEIITAYLNTIYFGRGAYGIEAAAQAYFDKDTKDLSASEAAYLAGIIQAPSRGDDPEYAEQRWDYVLDQMVKHNWLSESAREESEFPEPQSADQTQLKGFSGSARHVKDRVDAELADIGSPEEQVRIGGYTIHTTLEEDAQKLAEETVNDVMEGEPGNLREALVAVDPETGGVRAYYGGPYNDDNQTDWANTPRNPGSTMKAFDFVGLLKQGKGPNKVYDGTSPRTFPGDSEPVHNSQGNQCPSCTVAQAMEESINTVFYDMVVNDVKPKGVVEAAREAGISDRSQLDSNLNNIAIGGGDNAVTPRDMAAAYATFAAEGTQRDSHLVQKITTPEGDVVYEAEEEDNRAFDDDADKNKQIAGNVTQTLEPVPAYSNRACAGGRPCAAKTGTHEAPGSPGQNSQAWMVGYTPSISASVWIGDPAYRPIQDMNGSPIYGSGLPGAIWQQFLDKYLEGKPHEQFPDVETIGSAEQPQPQDQQPQQPQQQQPQQDNGRPTENDDSSEETDDTTERPTDEPTDDPDPTEPDEPPDDTGPPPTDDDGGDDDGDFPLPDGDRDNNDR